MERGRPRTSTRNVVVAIVGLGLIGGSVGLGLIESGFASHVVGYDRDLNSAYDAQARGCVHDVVSDLTRLPEASLLVLAPPPRAVASCLSAVLPRLCPNTAVTDCTSVKGAVMAEVPGSLRAHYVGGHPMAGLHVSGAQHARSDLFRDAWWVLTPCVETETSILRRVESMVYALDARPVQMDAQEHDEHVALLSHLPHVLAAMLVQMGERLPGKFIAGGSWRDLTRVAGSPPPLWEEILSANRATVGATLAELRQELELFEAMLAVDDHDALRRYLSDAVAARQRLGGNPPRDAE